MAKLKSLQCRKCHTFLAAPKPHPLDEKCDSLAVFSCPACGNEETFRKTEKGEWTQRPRKRVEKL